MKSLMGLEEAAALIQRGKRVWVGGDERLLAALPRGEWIGGTIPYFMSEDGGICTHEKVQVVVLPDAVTDAEIAFYESGRLDEIPNGYKQHGFSYAIVPAFSTAHRLFAEQCTLWPGIFNQPLVGWISGIDLSDLGKITPKVFNGRTGESSDSKALVMHAELSENTFAHPNIINLFKQGDGDVISFSESGFNVTDCFVNGEKTSFAKYLEEKQVDTHLPLVADYMGAMINVSFQGVDAKAGRVSLYAPVFAGIEYKVASPVHDYEDDFRKELETRAIEPVFTCNCILNYLYARLEGKKTGHIVGPMTFGEIAYMLLNQTLVYLTFESK